MDLTFGENSFVEILFVSNICEIREDFQTFNTCSLYGHIGPALRPEVVTQGP